MTREVGGGRARVKAMPKQGRGASHQFLIWRVSERRKGTGAKGQARFWFKGLYLAHKRDMNYAGCGREGMRENGYDGERGKGKVQRMAVAGLVLCSLPLYQ